MTNPPRLYLLQITSLLLAVALIHACVDEEPEPVSSPGTVVFNRLEGGFYGIVSDDGRTWDPDNLPDSLAIDSLRVSFQGVPTGGVTFHTWGTTISLSSVQRTGNPPKINLEPFRELARNASCADVVNRLFLIDGYLVFWDRESKCADASFARTLYGRRVDHEMCRTEDSIAGPRQSCHDRARYSAIFNTIIANLEKPDLGLGTSHTVEPVDF